MEFEILNRISSPEDVKKLNTDQLQKLCVELRECIIDTVSKNGGHLASNLGVVELTVALHRTFNTPNDSIIFDVGHQCYTHKLLTGRFKDFSALRCENGISGFMRPNESEYDPVITGHSSSSISSAYGIFCANKLLNKNNTTVAVIGDGALTGGMAYEALNNVASKNGNFIVVLNDNKMSISQNVGALARVLTKMRNKPKYHYFKFALSRFLLKIPLIGEHINNFIFKFKEIIKSLVYRNNFFSSLGLNYLGPVDGHDIAAMESLFNIAKSYNRPSLVHVLTVKGKGYSYAETNPNSYHGVSPFNVGEGASSCSNPTFSDIAGNTLCRLAKDDEKICAVTAAMTSGTGLTEFAEKYPERFFDVGIAEQHAATFCAGLKKGGLKPFFAVYSSFLQRAYDQIIEDTAIENLPVCFLVDRAGIVGEDGETHQGIFDISYLSSIPNINIYSPSGFAELEYNILTAANSDTITAIRYPRGCEDENITEYDYKSPFTVLGKNSDKAVVTYGRIFGNALKAQKTAEFDIIKLNKVYPFSGELIETLKQYKQIDVFEETVINGSIGEHLLTTLNDAGYNGKFKIHAINNKFLPTSTTQAAFKNNGLDADSIRSI